MTLKLLDILACNTRDGTYRPLQEIHLKSTFELVRLRFERGELTQREL